MFENNYKFVENFHPLPRRSLAFTPGGSQHQAPLVSILPPTWKKAAAEFLFRAPERCNGYLALFAFFAGLFLPPFNFFLLHFHRCFAIATLFRLLDSGFALINYEFIVCWGIVFRGYFILMVVPRLEVPAREKNAEPQPTRIPMQ